MNFRRDKIETEVHLANIVVGIGSLLFFGVFLEISKIRERRVEQIN